MQGLPPLLTGCLERRHFSPFYKSEVSFLSRIVTSVTVVWHRECSTDRVQPQSASCGCEERTNLMDTWLHFPIAFVSGFALGGVTIFLHLRSRLRFYKRFIETRLASINVPIRCRGVRLAVNTFIPLCDLIFSAASWPPPSHARQQNDSFLSTIPERPLTRYRPGTQILSFRLKWTFKYGFSISL